MNFFERLIWDFGEATKLPFRVDENGAVCLLIEESIPIHLEMDRLEAHVMIIATLAEIPAGKFREVLLKAALQANGTYQPYGTLSYAEKKNRLILHQFLPKNHCNIQKLLEFLPPFIAYAEAWQRACDSGVPPTPSSLSTPGKNNLPPPFSIR